MFSKLRLKYRIMLGYSVPLFLSVIAFTVIYVNTGTMEIKEALVDQSNMKIIQFNELRHLLNGMLLSAYSYTVEKDDASLKNYEGLYRGYNESLQALFKLENDPKQRELLQRVAEFAKRIDAGSRELVSAAKEGKNEKAMQVFGEALRIEQELQALDDAYMPKENASLLANKNDSMTAMAMLRNSIFAGMLLTLLFAVATGLWVASRISATLVKTVSAMSATSAEIAATVNQQERTASQQAAMVNETTTTMEQLGASSRQSAEQSESAVAGAQKASSLTEEGSHLVVQAVDAMDSLREKVAGISAQILELSDQTAQINNLAEIVKDLSTEINMLALNAAVEAARAGEQGKGFAVVAAEVRKLAGESRKSAEQAKNIITDIQAATNATIMTMEEGTHQVEEVATFARRIGEFFTELAEAAGTVYHNSQQAMLNARQQSAAIGQVVIAANTINAGAKETADGITQTKLGIQQLNEAAQQLKAMV